MIVLNILALFLYIVNCSDFDVLCFHISEMFPLMFQTNMALLDSCRPLRKDIQSMSVAYALWF